MPCKGYCGHTQVETQGQLHLRSTNIQSGSPEPVPSYTLMLNSYLLNGGGGPGQAISLPCFLLIL